MDLKTYFLRLTVLVICAGSLAFAFISHNDAMRLAEQNANQRQVISNLSHEKAALVAKVKELESRVKIGSVGNADLSNEEILQLYSENEVEIAALWLEMGEETTMKQAVVAWLDSQDSFGSARHGGVWDSLVRGKDIAAIMSSALVLDSAKTSPERLEAAANLADSIAAKTDSKVLQLLANHFRNPNAASLQALVDFVLEKK